MVLSNPPARCAGLRRSALGSALPLALALVVAGCSVTGTRESPINEITRDSPTVVDIYRGHAAGSTQSGQDSSAQQRLRTDSMTRPIVDGDGNTRRYWSALEPLQQRFARVPNPDLVMVVYPHLAKGKYPVPGYVTVFPMYDQTFYALPGEVPEDLIQGRALYQGPKQSADKKTKAPQVAAGDQPVAGH